MANRRRITTEYAAVGFSTARQVGYDNDTLHRVTQAAYTLPGSPTTSFHYDLLGNRVAAAEQPKAPAGCPSF